MTLLGPFLALNLSINSSIFLYLVNVTQARCVLTTNFWTSGYAAFLSFGRSLLNNRATSLYRNNGYGRHYHQLCAHEQC